MKKTILILTAIATLASCGGGTGSGSSRDGVHAVSTTDTTANESASQSTTTYQYVEPKEDIAKIILDSLVNNDYIDPDIWSAIAEADDDNELDECFDTISNTYRHFSQNKWARYDNYSYNAEIALKCYQTNKSEWIGVVMKSIYTFADGDETESKGVYPVLYSNGKLTRLDSSKVFPTELLRVLKLVGETNSIHWRFENTYFATYSDNYWPLRFLFDGEKFVTDPATPLLFNVLAYGDGDFNWVDNNANKYWIQLNSTPDSKDNIQPDGTLKADGKTLAKFEITDGKVMGYTLLDPSCGVAQNTKSDSVVGKPVAIGQPIKNVLDRPRVNSMKDTTETSGIKDGKFVVLQHVKRDDYYNFDIYHEFIAKDENSNIESIRIYCTPYTASLEDDIKNNKNMTPEFREAFNTFKFTERYPKCGTYSHLIGGASDLYLKFSDGAYFFVAYQLDDGGLLILVANALSVRDADQKNIKAWIYKNGNFDETQCSLPKPPAEFSDMDFEMEFREDGLHYSNYSEKEFLSYPWNGKKFVNQYEEEETANDTINDSK